MDWSVGLLIAITFRQNKSMTDVTTGFVDISILWAASGMSGFHGTAHDALAWLRRKDVRIELLRFCGFHDDGRNFDETPVELVDVAVLARIESLDNIGKYFSD